MTSLRKRDNSAFSNTSSLASNVGVQKSIDNGRRKEKVRLVDKKGHVHKLRRKIVVRLNELKIRTERITQGRLSSYQNRKYLRITWIVIICACFFYLVNFIFTILFGGSHSVRGGLLGAQLDAFGKTLTLWKTGGVDGKKVKFIDSRRDYFSDKQKKLLQQTNYCIGSNKDKREQNIGDNCMPRFIIQAAINHDSLFSSSLAALPNLAGYKEEIKTRHPSNLFLTWDHYYERIVFSDEDILHDLKINIGPLLQQESSFLSIPNDNSIHLIYEELLEQQEQTPETNKDDLSTVIQDKEILWAICSMYYYGGIFLSSNNKISHLHTNTLDGISSLRSVLDTHKNTDGYFIFTEKAKGNFASFDFMAARPRSPTLAKVIQQIPKLYTENKMSFSRRLYATLYDYISQEESIDGEKWILFYENCDSFSCDIVHKEQTSNSIPILSVINGRTFSHTSFQQSITRSQGIEQPVNDVTIYEDPPLISATSLLGLKNAQEFHKQSLQSAMIEKKCEPSWLCNRCLRNANYGTFKNCSFSCSKCFQDIICHPDEKLSDNEEAIIKKSQHTNFFPVFLEKQEITVHVNVKMTSNHIREESKQTLQPLIPRIIHQTWFEPLTPEKYPDLVRIQNSWRSQGWEYKFYTDETSRMFIQKHFPERFLIAYDSLIPGAYKADLFRYMVLLIEGGVYADIDIQLNTNLDTFITPDIAFFVPRDLPGFITNQEFCLWNGLIGSAPGHVYMVEALERTVNLIYNRADLFDMEREMCQSSDHNNNLLSSNNFENWKVRCKYHYELLQIVVFVSLVLFSRFSFLYIKFCLN